MEISILCAYLFTINNGGEFCYVSNPLASPNTFCKRTIYRRDAYSLMRNMLRNIYEVLPMESEPFLTLHICKYMENVTNVYDTDSCTRQLEWRRVHRIPFCTVRESLCYIIICAEIRVSSHSPLKKKSLAMPAPIGKIIIYAYPEIFCQQRSCSPCIFSSSVFSLIT